ncbi:hypothetical protein D3C71_1361180 [compost metagenome]
MTRDFDRRRRMRQPSPGHPKRWFRLENRSPSAARPMSSRGTCWSFVEDCCFRRSEPAMRRGRMLPTPHDQKNRKQHFRAGWTAMFYRYLRRRLPKRLRRNDRSPCRNVRGGSAGRFARGRSLSSREAPSQCDQSRIRACSERSLGPRLSLSRRSRKIRKGGSLLV